MSDQQTFFSRLGSWFKKGSRPEADGSVMLNGENGNPPALTGPIETRSTFLRPWAKRDAAIENLQNGLGELSDLMGSIRKNMERQSERQDELLTYLSHLPQALQQLPESNRVQGETLKAICQQMETQNSQQGKLGEILERITRTDQQHSSTLGSLESHVQSLDQHDKAISASLSSVGEVMATVGKSSQASTQVLQQMHESLSTRDSEMQTIIKKQGMRFTVLLSIAISLSVGAIAAVAGVGYMMMQHMK